MTSLQKQPDRFRVVIFGSARLKEDNPSYTQVRELSTMIAAAGYDIVTGGGPGIMDAALRGHYEAKHPEARAIGLPIKLPHEDTESEYAEILIRFKRFGDRLDTFMALADAVIVAPGGIGTLLELFYTIQLMQVKHTSPVPIILLGEHWPGLVQWIREGPLADGMLNAKDLDVLLFAETNDEVMRILKDAHARNGSSVNLLKYPSHAAMLASTATRDQGL